MLLFLNQEIHGNHRLWGCSIPATARCCRSLLLKAAACVISCDGNHEKDSQQVQKP
jgi:hypothetical protein